MMIVCRGVSTEEQKRRIIDQLIRIDKMLKEAVEARPTWLIVAGHYPVYSIGTATAVLLYHIHYVFINTLLLLTSRLLTTTSDIHTISS